MKPQCNPGADCLRELARVMEQFDPDSPWSYVWPELFSLPEYVTKSKCTNLIHH